MYNAGSSIIVTVRSADRTDLLDTSDYTDKRMLKLIQLIIDGAKKHTLIKVLERGVSYLSNKKQGIINYVKVIEP